VVPAVVLCAVALHQIELARAHDLSPWKGGGFGMFSTTDAGRQRDLRVYLVEPGRVRPVAIPAPLDELALRAAALPTPARLRRLAARVGAEVGGVAPGLSAVRVELWRTHFEPDGLLPTATRLRSVELPWPDDGG
jgi:hypothetical protein